MNYNAKFWVLMAIFQFAFGLVVFAITRQVYAPGPNIVGHMQAAPGQPSLDWIDRIPETNPALFDPVTSNQSTIRDPEELSRQANVYFANQQYAMAAVSYEKLLAFVPNDVDTHNNLGITLHYLGRSAEALRRLNDGVALDPTYQRIWLTLGFVHSQVGNLEEARAALTTAVEMGVDTNIGQSAARMLENLP